MPEINLGKVVGPQGPQGVQGEAGAQGIQGIQGPTGEAGKSAYQAARDGGYTGTEAEFNAIMAIIDAHAGRHKTGGADPLTAADVGALSATGYITDFDNIDSLRDGVYLYNGWAHGNITHTVDLPFIQAYGVWIKKTPYGTGGETVNRHDTVINTKTGDVYTMTDYDGAWSKNIADALPRDGSAAMTGDLRLQKADNGYGYIIKNHNATVSYGTSLVDVDKNGKQASISANAENSQLLWNSDNLVHTILHTGNYSDYALPRDGSAAMTGRLWTSHGIIGQMADNSSLRLEGGPDYNKGAYLNLAGASNQYEASSFSLVASAPDKSMALVGFVDGHLKWGGWGGYDILHTGNKPSDRYPGTSGAQTLPIGGIGDVVFIQSDASMLIVGIFGAFGYVYAGDERVFKSFGWSEVQYANGELILNTNDLAVNDSAHEYLFQVL